MDTEALILATTLIQSGADSNLPHGIEGHSSRSEEEKMKAKGMSFWQFRGFDCWALNYKSAMKKYNRFLKK